MNQKKYVTAAAVMVMIAVVLVCWIWVNEESVTIKEQRAADGTTTFHCDTGQKEGRYKIYQLPMTDTPGGACYAIEMPNKKLIMIDSGYEQDGVPIKEFIAEHGGVVDSWIVTHPHFDHIGGLLYNLAMKDEDIIIENVYYSPFTAEFFREEKEGKNLKLINNAIRFEEFEKKRQESDAQYIPMNTGDVIQIEDVTIQCRNSFDEEEYDVNTNSLVLHIDISGVEMLITGDMTDVSLEKMELEFGKESNWWKVDFVQAPHHGYIAGISDDTLYERTDPTAVFVDCSTSEYEEDAVNIRTHIKWIEDLGISVVKRFEGMNRIVIN